MKYLLEMDKSIHNTIKVFSALAGETMKDFILKAANERIKTVKFFMNKELQKDIKNRNNINFIEVNSIKDIFK